MSNLQFENVGRGQLPTRRFVEKLRQLVGQLDSGQLIDDRRDIVVTVARRNQIPLYRLLEKISTTEFRESDSARRAELAEMKNLVARIQRNDERLLTVVDDESVRRGGREVARLDAILLAQADLRAPRRIEFPHVDREIEIVENVVYDLGVLIGELIENAVNFSAPDSEIRVDARRRPGGAFLAIEDQGIGIKPEPLARLNERLSGPPILDAEILRQMGLAVVARLAHRHGLAVHLRSTFESGTTAEITLPDSVIATTRGRNARWPEIPAKVIRAGIAALPRDEAKNVLDELSQQQVRVILAGLAAERAQAILDQGRNSLPRGSGRRTVLVAAGHDGDPS